MPDDTPQSVEKPPGDGLRQRAARARVETQRLAEVQRLLFAYVCQTFERRHACRAKSAVHDSGRPS